jgi:hypothetical protein
MTKQSQRNLIAGLKISTSANITSKKVILQTEQDIEILCQKSRDLFHSLHLKEIVVSLEGLPTETVANMEVRLNTYLKECGCSTGNVTGSVGVLIYLALLYTLVGEPFVWTWKHLGIGLVFCFSLAVLGKLASRLRARIRLTQELEQLLVIFKHNEQT